MKIRSSLLQTLLLASLAFVSSAATGPILTSSMGIESLPDDDEPVCPIPTVASEFSNVGLRVGDTIPDFTLYTLDGAAVNARAELRKGKPLLLVAGSYTCPVYRAQMPALNQIYKKYGSRVSIYVVYVVEAHPVTDPSPYRGKEWVTDENKKVGVLFRQPTTYGVRKEVASAMLSKLNILPPVLLDGPCNGWWSTFGPMPNNACLIDTNGRIVSRHDWFNRAPRNMAADIDRLLARSSGG